MRIAAPGTLLPHAGRRVNPGRDRLSGLTAGLLAVFFLELTYPFL